MTADHRLMLEQSKRIIGGIRLFARILGNPRCIVGIEANKRDAAEVMRQAAQGTNVEIRVLPVKYPQGSEKQLIQVLAGRQVPSGKLPMDAGCVVANVSSAAAAYDSAVLRRPVTERVLTVTGAVEHPRNLLVRVGTRMEELVGILRRIEARRGSRGFRRPDDGHCAVRSFRAGGQGNQRRAGAHPRADQPRQAHQLHPVRSLRARLSHASDAV